MRTSFSSHHLILASFIAGRREDRAASTSLFLESFLFSLGSLGSLGASLSPHLCCTRACPSPEFVKLPIALLANLAISTRPLLCRLACLRHLVTFWILSWILEARIVVCQRVRHLVFIVSEIIHLTQAAGFAVATHCSSAHLSPFAGFRQWLTLTRRLCLFHLPLKPTRALQGNNRTIQTRDQESRVASLICLRHRCLPSSYLRIRIRYLLR